MLSLNKRSLISGKKGGPLGKWVSCAADLASMGNQGLLWFPKQNASEDLASISNRTWDARVYSGAKARPP